MTSKKKVPVSGAPRWTYVAGAIVSIGTLLLGIATYVNSKPEPSRPATRPIPSVSVSGAGNVGIGTMSGGTVSVGVPTKADSGHSAAGSTKKDRG